MSDTVEYDLTANYGLKKPWDDADDDVWGPHMNENMDLIDNLLVTRGFDASKYLPLAGGTMLGELILAADPVNPLDAATKRYVDGSIGGAVGAYLPLTGGEVTGNLQVDGALNVGTPGGAGFKLDVAGTGRVSGPFTVGSDTATSAAAQSYINGAAGTQRSFILRTTSLGRWLIMADNSAETGANAGSNFTIGTYTDAGVYNGPVVIINRATKVVSITGTLANTTLGQDTGITAQFLVNAPVGLAKQIYFRSASSSRWVIQANASAESGSNAGSDFSIFRYDDTGVPLGNALSILRSTGVVTIPGALTLSSGGSFSGTFAGAHTYSSNITFLGSITAGNLVTLGSNTAVSPLLQNNGAAASQRQIQFLTAGLVRWRIAANAVPEAGANAGSDLDFTAYDDTGAVLGNPMLKMSRATGMVTAYFGLTVNAGAARFNGTIGFNNTAPIAKPTVTGAKAGNTALASLCAALVSYGLIADTSTA